MPIRFRDWRKWLLRLSDLIKGYLLKLSIKAVLIDLSSNKIEVNAWKNREVKSISSSIRILAFNIIVTYELID